MLITPVKGTNPENLSLYSFGGVLGLYYFPLSRFFTRIDTTLGVYQPSLEGSNGQAAFFWRAGGEAGFRFTPGFTLAVNAGWRQYSDSGGGAFNSGISVGLTAQISFQTGTGSARETVTAGFEQFEPVYPAFMQLYQTNPIGAVVIRNNENAEIRDVQVSFRASPYTASEFPCGSVSLIARGRSVELPLLADFSPEILRFTDSGRILGELVIRYSFLGQQREVIRALTVATNNRNTVTTGDTAALAAFISPTSPETLAYAKHIAGLARANRRLAHNQNMQFALWLHEGLRASGVRLGTTYSSETEAQFPAETLSHGTGSSRDLVLLFAAALEGVGIPSAIIKLEDEILVAFSLEIGRSAAESMFNGLERILVINDQVWLPLATSVFNEGFMAAWRLGAAGLNKAFAAGKEVDFVLVEEAWAAYPPAPLPEQGGRIVHTDPDAVKKEADQVMQQYIEQELAPLVRQVEAQANSRPTAALYNRLAILMMRSGRVDAAKANYERAAGMGSVPAMTNRGNLALTEKDYATAERWYRRALTVESNNSAALWGLQQIEDRR